MSPENNRYSRYDVLPGHTAIINDHSAFSQTNLFQYGNQLQTSTTTVEHPLGIANLFFAFELHSTGGGPKFSNIGGTPVNNAIQLPDALYIFDDPDEDGTPNLFPYGFTYVRMNRRTYECVFHALYGPPGDILEYFPRVAILHDSFVAPFVQPEVL